MSIQLSKVVSLVSLRDHELFEDRGWVFYFTFLSLSIGYFLDL